MIEDILKSGAETVNRNRSLALMPLLSYAVYSIILMSYLALIALSTFGFAFSGVAAIASYACASAAALLAFVMASSFFSAAIIGAAHDAVNGKTLKADTYIEWGKKRWLRLFSVNTLVILFYLALLELFAPTVILIILGEYAAATFVGLITGAAVAALAAAASILLMPLSYLAVLDDAPMMKLFSSSEEFVKKNIVECLTLSAVAMATYNVIGGFTSIFTGPLMMIPYVGVLLAIPLIILLSVCSGAIMEAVTTVWWVKIIADKKKRRKTSP